jgi:hypothetical protein
MFHEHGSTLSAVAAQGQKKGFPLLASTYIFPSPTIKAGRLQSQAAGLS